jgi:hypothetical protein
MDQFAALFSREIPKDRTPLLGAALTAWNLLSTKIVANFRDEPEESAKVMAATLCKWRAATAKLKWRDADDAAALYLVEAAMRLAVLDWLHARPAPADAATRIFDTRPLSICERTACSKLFEAIEPHECEEYARRITAQWTQSGSKERELEQLGKLAHALLVVPNTTKLPSRSTLIAASRLGVVTTQRALLRELSSHDSPSEAPPKAINVEQWVLSRVTAPKSEAAAKGHYDAVALDNLDPLSLPHVDALNGFSAISAVTSAGQLLTMQHPDVATRAAGKAKDWAIPATDRHRCIVALSIFDYACKQMHSVEWARAYTATDARPAAALERIRRYADERIANPPPLILVLDDSAVLLKKVNLRVKCIGIYKGIDILSAWIHHAKMVHITAERLRGVMEDAESDKESASGRQELNLALIPLLA